jgi:predicted MFS family arabinose efflux permease
VTSGSPGGAGRAGGSSRGAVAAVVAVAVLYATIFTVPPLIAPVFHDRLGFSFADAGLLMTIYLVAYAAVSLPAGMLADRFGPGKVIAVGLVLAGVASVLFPVSHGLGWFLVLRGVIGVGAALVYTPGIALIRSMLPPERAHAGVGWFTVGLSAGITVAYFSVPRIEHAIGWEWPFRIYGIVALAGLAILALVPKRGWVGGGKALGNPLRGMGPMLRNRVVMMASVSLFLTMFVLYGALTYVIPFYDKEGGFSPSGISNSGLAVAAAAIPASIAGGWLSDRLRKPAEVMAVFSLLTAVIVLLWVVPSGNGAILVVIGVAATFAGTATVVPLFTLPSIAVRPEDAGVATGLATAIGMSGAILSTYLGGWIIDWTGFGVAFLVFAIVAGVAAVLMGPMIRAELRRQPAPLALGSE